MLKVVAGLCFLLLLTPNPALAHKVLTSYWAEEDTIEGEIGFSNGEYALPGTAVEVTTTEGEHLGEAVIGEEGIFSFTPTQPIPHRFHANMGAGHIADFIVAIEDLPHKLASRAKPTEMAKPEDSPVIAVPTGLDQRIAAAVRREVKPLRKEIAAYKEKNDLQSILGGIGYIVGIFGLYMFVQSRRRKDSPDND